MNKSSSRSAPPATLAFPAYTESSCTEFSPRSSNEKTSRPFSGDYSSASLPPTPRKDSSGSSKSYSSGSVRKPSSPTVNAHSYCGRHSSQWLFSGWSVPDVFRRKNS